VISDETVCSVLRYLPVKQDWRITDNKKIISVNNMVFEMLILRSVRKLYHKLNTADLITLSPVVHCNSINLMILFFGSFPIQTCNPNSLRLLSFLSSLQPELKVNLSEKKYAGSRYGVRVEKEKIIVLHDV
jgi:hypothetical protein